MRISSVCIALVSVTVLFIPLFVVFAQQSEVIETDVSVGNMAPTIDSINISDTQYGADAFSSGITPNPGTTKSIYVNGIVTDLNGASTTASTSVTFYRSGVTGGSGCSLDNNDCYALNQCLLNDAYGTDLEAQYSCQLDLQYWIDATDSGGRYPNEEWIAEVVAIDNVGSSTVATSSVEVNSLLALELPSSISYGALPLGATTTVDTNTVLSLAQNGNAQSDVEISGTAMTCSDTGTIPVSNQKWSIDDVGYDHASTTALSGTPVRTYRGVPYRDSETQNEVRNLYLNIAIPSQGVSGVCTGSNTITVLAATDTGGESGTGTLLDDVVGGVWYESPSFSGYTSRDGTFDFNENETTVFKIGKITLGSIPGSKIAEDELVFIQDLVGVMRPNVQHREVKKLGRLLQSLDEDQNPDNGIYIPEHVHDTLSWPVHIQELNMGHVNFFVRRAYGRGHKIFSDKEVREHLQRTLRKYNITE